MTNLQFNLQQLAELVEAVERAGVDIAPTYQEYMPMCCGIANSTGEKGRNYFDRLCRLSAKYDTTAGNQLYTFALSNPEKRYYTLEYVFNLARNAGVLINPYEATPPKIPESEGDRLSVSDPKVAKVAKVADDPSATHIRVPYNANNDFSINGSDPLTPLPIIKPYAWPSLIQQTMDLAGQTDQQRDVLFLTSMSLIGICLARNVRVLYGHHHYHPCLQCFIVAPPASGKGVMTFVRRLVDPFHRDIRKSVEKAWKAYEKRIFELSSMGKRKSTEEVPEKPVNKMFIIPGDNTGTGILQNLIDSDGWGLIFETEADTLSSAIDSEYGKWSDTLRNAFDEEHLSYNRRGNGGEYRECEQTLLAVMISGTPAQFKNFVKSAEDGTFSRQVYYYMQPSLTWINQLGETNRDLEKEFDKMGQAWKKSCDQLRQLGLFTLELTTDQIKRFNHTLDLFFQRSALTNGLDMTSAVKRMAINLVRIMEVIATLRLMDAMQPEDYDRPKDLPLAHPHPSLRNENLQDRLITHWQLEITEDDFQAVIDLADVLYAHTVHMLSFLPGVQIMRRYNSEIDTLLHDLPNPFTTEQFMQKAAEMGIPAGTAKSWLHRLKEENKLIEQIDRGVYRIRI